MSNALVPIGDLVSWAQHMMPSQAMPEKLRNKMADVLAIITAGSELGMPPWASLRNLHLIEGKVVPSADSMVGIVRGSGKCESWDVVETTDKIATIETKRVGGKVQRLSYSIEEAKLAGLTNKDNWRKFPAAMLRARCQSALCRMVYQDVLAGCYSSEEVADFSNAPAPAATLEPEVVIDEDTWKERIAAVADSAELLTGALAIEFGELPDGEAKERIRKLAKNRRASLTRAYADAAAKENAQ
jgi:hypothetical protein